MSSEVGNLSRVDSPVETHLSVESNLVSPADQPEPLAALVVGRPVVRTGVRFVGSRSICLAELTLRDVLAAVSFAPISDGSLKTRNAEPCMSSVCSPGCSQGKHSFHGSKRWVRLSSCTYECGRASASFTETVSCFRKIIQLLKFDLTRECCQRRRRLCCKPSRAQGRRTTWIETQRKRREIHLGRPVMAL